MVGYERVRGSALQRRLRRPGQPLDTFGHTDDSAEPAHRDNDSAEHPNRDNDGAEPAHRDHGCGEPDRDAAAVGLADGNTAPG